LSTRYTADLFSNNNSFQFLLKTLWTVSRDDERLAAVVEWPYRARRRMQRHRQDEERERQERQEIFFVSGDLNRAPNNKPFLATPGVLAVLSVAVFLVVVR
jgi:hypothetical protein